MKYVGMYRDSGMHTRVQDVQDSTCGYYNRAVFIAASALFRTSECGLVRSDTGNCVFIVPKRNFRYTGMPLAPNS